MVRQTHKLPHHLFYRRDPAAYALNYDELGEGGMMNWEGE
jgi:hypothetical protein